MERRKLHHMYQRARTHEIIMQKLLPEVPRFKTHPIFANDSDMAGSKLEEAQSHQLEQSHKSPLPQQPLTSPTVASRVDHSATNSQLSRDSDYELLREERSLTTSSNKASSELEFEHPASTCMADGVHKPVLIPLTMDTAMNNFPVRVSIKYYCDILLFTKIS